MSSNFNNIRVPINALPRVLKALYNEQTTLLGGDLLDKDGQFTYDSWYYNYEESKSACENCIASIKKAEEFLRLRDKVNPDKVFEEVERRGINVITFDDSRYPYMLSQIYNPPMVLYYKGDIFECNLERAVAFVGSRRASTNGKDSVRGIISDLKNTDICIVSGLAEGIDAVSHRSAIENNLKTIGVIASGFDFSYPASNKDLYEKLEHGAGAVVTEYYPTFEPIKFRFPQKSVGK